MNKPSIKTPLAMAVLLLTSACTHRPVLTPTAPTQLPNPQHDGAPASGFDPDRVKHVMAQQEPLSAYGNHSPYTVLGKTYKVMQNAQNYHEQGIASWYGTKFHGRRTSSWEPYDMYAMTAAHKTLPLPSYVKVRHLKNNQEIIVKVNDRGPFHPDRIIDLSYAAAHELGMVDQGTAPVEVSVLSTPEITTAPALTTKQETQFETHEPGNPVFLQAGAFEHIEKAESLKTALTGVTPHPITVKTTHHEPQHRVHIGPIASESEAINIINALRSQEIAHPFIVR